MIVEIYALSKNKKMAPLPRNDHIICGGISMKYMSNIAKLTQVP